MFKTHKYNKTHFLLKVSFYLFIYLFVSLFAYLYIFVYLQEIDQELYQLQNQTKVAVVWPFYQESFLETNLMPHTKDVRKYQFCQAI